MRQILLMLAITGSFLSSAFAVAINGSGPGNFIYQGEIYQADGVTPSTAAVDLILGIYSADGTCLLYEERQTIDLSVTQGAFAVSIGSPAGAAKRTSNDPGMSMTNVFSNTSVRPSPSALCPSPYAAASGDAKRMRVTVVQGSVTTAMTPDLTLGSAPTAMVADTIQGISPSGLLQTNMGLNLSQSAIESIFLGTNYSDLMQLIGGTSPKYISSTAGNFSAQNTKLTNLAPPTSVTDAANKNYVDNNLGGGSMPLVGAFMPGQAPVSNGAGSWIPTTVGTVTNVSSGSSFLTVANPVTNPVINVSGILPVANGGTGMSNLSSLVDLSSVQSITGPKTFSSLVAGSITGSAAPSGTLTIDSTTNATKGLIILSPSANGKIGVGTPSPAVFFDVVAPIAGAPVMEVRNPSGTSVSALVLDNGGGTQPAITVGSLGNGIKDIMMCATLSPVSPTTPTTTTPATFTITCANVAIGDNVNCSPATPPTGTVSWNSYVSGAGIITVKLFTTTTASAPPSSMWSCTVFR